MNKLKQAILYILFSFMLFSCKTRVDDKNLGRTNDIVVLTGFLTPSEDSITIGLNIAKGITKNKKITIYESDLQNATVQISSENRVIDLKFIGFNNQMAIFYAPSQDLPILVNKTYSIVAKNSTIFELSATTTVPNDNFDFTHTVDGPFPITQGGTVINTYKVLANIDNSLSASNFFLLECRSLDELYSFGRLEYIKTSQTNQAHILKDLLVYEESSNLDSSVISVTNISESYYNYFVSLQNGYSEGDPFAEPSTLYTNVTGGKGIFASMVSKEKPFR